VLHPVGTGSRPTYYLLDGVDSPAAESNWVRKTDIRRFFADKDVNVVLPVGGGGSYYTDWQQRDPRLGLEHWETFLTAELPPLVDRTFHGDGSNVIGGLSMGGTAAAILAFRHRDLYRGVAVFSGCPDTVTPDAQWVVWASVLRQGGDPNNMWGPPDTADWVSHDPLTHAEEYRGMAVYLAVGGGVPGPRDSAVPGYPGVLALSVPLEEAAQFCTDLFRVRLATLGIPATYVFHGVGTHSWPYWQDDLHESWPVLAAALDRSR
jgi:S-formylglutathione hydrolase FrmB